MTRPAHTVTAASTGEDADLFLRGLNTLTGAYWRLARLGRRRPEVRAVDRDVPVVVAATHDETDDVRAVTLADPDGRPLPHWTPGAHLDLLLPSGRIRQYSLCGDPAERDRYRIAVRRLDDGDGGSREVHCLGPGARLVVRGPRNAFPFVPADAGAPLLFLAGGIGITPILPMVRACARAGADWHLVVCGRSRASMPFLDELCALESSTGPDDPPRVWIRPDDEYGGPPCGAELVGTVPGAAAVWCCGPPPMLAVVRAASPAGPGHALHVERFSAPPVIDGQPFTVELDRSGRRVEVAADETTLEAVRRVAPDLASSCRQGFCGVCRVGLLAGAAEHRDHVLGPDERTTAFIPCVSRARGGSLTLDL